MHGIVKKLAGAVAVVAFLAAPAFAADHEILMLNKGADGAMVFEPAFLKIAPGDSVTFVPTDKGHYVESIKDMIPDGAEAFKSKMNQTFQITLDQPGSYAVKCLPHFGMGMVGLIVVGDEPGDLEQLKAMKMPKKAKDRMDVAIAAAEQL